MKKPPQNILIYRLGSLGDTVIALPCFNRIRECYPDADITLLTNKPVSAKAAPLEAILGNTYFFSRSLSYPVGTRNPFVISKLIREIRKLKIDMVINITAFRYQNADLRDKLFFQSAGVSEFIGFDQNSEDSNKSANSDTGEVEWEAQRLSRKIEALGSFDINLDKYWDLHLSPEENTEVSKAVSALDEGASILAISPGTKMPVKDWGRDAWMKLMGGLAKDYGHYNLVIVGAAGEAQLGEEFVNIWPGKVVNFCGKTSPRVSAGLLANADLFIGHDSGPTHLAACVGTPCIAIYSCINLPRKWFPRGEHNTILFPDTACAKNGMNTCSNPQEKCIHTIEPNTVAQAVREALKNPIKI